MSNPPVNITRTVPVIYYRHLSKLAPSGVDMDPPLPKKTTRQEEVTKLLRLCDYYVRVILPEFYFDIYMKPEADKLRELKPIISLPFAHLTGKFLRDNTPDPVGNDYTRTNPMKYMGRAVAECCYASDFRARMEILKHIATASRTLKIVLKEKFWEHASTILSEIAGESLSIDVDGIIEEEPNTRNIQSAVSQSLYEKVKELANDRGVTTSSMVRELIQKGISPDDAFRAGYRACASVASDYKIEAVEKFEDEELEKWRT